MNNEFKPISDAELSKFSIVPLGGRACWYFFHWGLLKNYTRNDPMWPLIVGGLAHLKDNFAKWYYLWPKDIDLGGYLKQYVSDFSLMGKIENNITIPTSCFIDRINSADLDTISDKDLQDLAMFFSNSFMDVSYTSVILRLIDLSVLDYFNNRFKGDSRKDEIIRHVAVFPGLSYLLKEELALAELAQKLKEGELSEDSDIFNKKIKEIKNLYCWTVCGYYNERPRSEADYVAMVRDLVHGDPLKKINGIMYRHQADLQMREGILSSFNDEEKLVASLAGESTRLKDYYKYSSNKLIFFGESIFKEIADRVKRPIDFIKNLEPREVIALIQGKYINDDLVSIRAKNSLILAFPGHRQEYRGEDMDEFEKKYLGFEKDSTGEFKGRVACAGIARGKVKVIKDSREFSKMEDGNILVVANTSPDYMSILSKAAAIVAEEGGITAHVSVVSREFGIPCIVGVKRITEILKDGDTVEVDANNGVARLVK
ncbi:MAG: PEP-utilizing enzyme [Candidatus Paceibacterota bacterium]|jgi:phosphohistidine swiveling domain-containing protein